MMDGCIQVKYTNRRTRTDWKRLRKKKKKKSNSETIYNEKVQLKVLTFIYVQLYGR